MTLPSSFSAAQSRELQRLADAVPAVQRCHRPTRVVACCVQSISVIRCSRWNSRMRRSYSTKAADCAAAEYCSRCSTAALRQARLDPGRLPPGRDSRRTCRTAPSHAAAGRVRRRPPPGGFASRRSGPGRAREDSSAIGGILRRQRRIDDADDERFEIVEAFEHDLPLLGSEAQAGRGRRTRRGKAGTARYAFAPMPDPASRALRAGSSIATTLQVCKFDEVEADCAAATRHSRVPSGNGSGR